MSFETYLAIQIIMCLVGIAATIGHFLEHDEGALRGMPRWYIIIMILAWPISLFLIVLVLLYKILEVIIDGCIWLAETPLGKWLTATPFNKSEK